MAFNTEIEEASKLIRQLLGESEKDGWVKKDFKKEVEIFEKAIPGRDLGILKGIGNIQGFSPIELLPITQLPSCRMVWDKMFLEAKVIRALPDSAFLSYAATKPQFPVRFAVYFLIFLFSYFLIKLKRYYFLHIIIYHIYIII